MSFARRHDVRPRRQAGANAKARQEGAAEEAFAERRLTRALWRRVDRPDELIALLRSLPEVERAQARVLLVRMLGGERAQPLLGRAYGDEARAASPAAEAPEADESEPSYSRAQVLRNRIVRALESGRAEPASLMALLAAAPRPVAESALWLLRSTPINGGGNARARLDALTGGARLGRGDGSWREAALAAALARNLSPLQPARSLSPLQLARSAAPGAAAPAAQAVPALDGIAGVGQSLSTMLRGSWQQMGAELGFSTELPGLAALDGVQAASRRAAQPAAQGKTAAEALRLGRLGMRRGLPFREEMEARFGRDLSKVECYFGAQAEAACRMVGANAFAVGNVIVFAAEPTRATVQHELTHVLQQGGDATSLGSTPDELGFSQPGDAGEAEAHAAEQAHEQCANQDGADQHSANQGAGNLAAGLELARQVNVAGTQPTTLDDVTAGVVPPGYEQKYDTFTNTGTKLTGDLGQTQDAINAVKAFPVGDVKSVLSGSSYNFLNPKSFFAGLKPEGDNFVEKVVNLVLGVCEKVLGVLDGVLGIVNKIMGIVENLQKLCKKISDVLKMIARILDIIAAALAATLFGGPLAAILRAISSACKAVANVLSMIADFLEQIVNAIKPIIDKLNNIKKQIEKVAEICKMVKEALDVYKWLTAKTAEERHQAAQNILSNIDLVKGFIGKFIGGRFVGFAEKFWSKAAPIVQPLQNVIHFQSSGGKAASGGGASPEQATNQAVVDVAAEHVQQEKAETVPRPVTSETANNAGQAFKEFHDEAKSKAPAPPKPKDDFEKKKQEETEKAEQEKAQHFQRQTEQEAAGATAVARGNEQPNIPEQQSKNPNDLSALNVPGVSEVHGDTGVSADAAHWPVNTASPAPPAPRPPAAAQASPDKYPQGAGQLFDYLQKVIDYQKNADEMKNDGDRRVQESQALGQNADNAKQALEETKRVSQQQRDQATQDKSANTDGIAFMEKLQGMSSKLQSDIAKKVIDAIKSQLSTDEAGNDGVGKMDSAGDRSTSGAGAGAGVMGIIKKVATTLLKSVLDQLKKKIMDGIIKKLIPGKLQQVFQLIMNFKGFATNASDKAKAKSEEHKQAEGVHKEAQGMDESGIATTQATDAQIDQQIQQAQENKATADKKQADGNQEIQRAQKLKTDLLQEQGSVEQKIEQRLAPFRALRDRAPAPPKLDTTPPAIVQQWQRAGAGLAKGDDPNLAPAANDNAPAQTQTPQTTQTQATQTQATQTQATQTQATQTQATQTQATQTQATQTQATQTQATTTTTPTTTPTPSAPATATPAATTTATAPSGAAPGADFISVRDPAPEQKQLDDGVQKRSVDPDPPPPAQQQTDQIQAPATAGLATTGAAHAQGVNEEKAKVPPPQGIYDTVKPLPTVDTPAPPKPFNAANMGTGDKQAINDAETKSIEQWTTTAQPQKELMKDSGGAKAALPQLQATKVAPSNLPQAPALPTKAAENVAPVQAPAIPVAEVKSESAEVKGYASGVMQKEIVQSKYTEVKGEADQHVADYKSQEQAAVQPMQQNVVQAQTDQQTQATSAFAKRDSDVQTERQQLGQGRDLTVKDAEGKAQQTHDTKVTESAGDLKTAQTKTDQTLRQGEKDGHDVENQAKTEEQNERTKAKPQATSAWGWFKEHVQAFVSDLVGMLGKLWDAAKDGVAVALQKARTTAMSMLQAAQKAIVGKLTELAGAIADIYSFARDKIAQLVTLAVQKLQQAITWAVQKITDLAKWAQEKITTLIKQAWDAVTRLTAWLKDKLSAAWAKFKELVDQVRRAPGKFLDALKNKANSKPPEAYWPNGHKTGVDDGGTHWYEVWSANAPFMQFIDRHGGKEATTVEEEKIMTPILNVMGDGVVGQTVANLAGKSEWPVIYAVQRFGGLKPSEQPAAHKELGPQVNDGKKQEQGDFEKSLPTLQAQTQGADPKATPSAAAKPAATNVEASDLNAGAAPNQQVAAAPKNGPAPKVGGELPGMDDKTPVDAKAQAIGTSMDSIPTADTNINTDPGAPPAMKLEGGADPKLVDTHTEDTGAKLNDALGTEGDRACEIARSEAARVQPLAFVEERKLDGLKQPGESKVGDIAGMEEFAQAGVDPEAQKAFDDAYQEKMQGAVTSANTSMTEASQTRDQARAAEIQKADQKLKDEAQKAQADQAKEVQGAHEKIGKERESSLQQQQSEIQKAKGQLLDERNQQLEKVDARQKDDQKKITDTYTKGAKDAQDKVKQGEQQAQQKKEDQKKAASEQSWWEKTVSVFKEAVSALKDAIHAVFQAVRDAVNAIFEAVRVAAKAIIDAGVAFVCEAIKAYGDFAKLLIRNTIGVIFPQLAEKLCQAVDVVVDAAQKAVRFIGEQLKKGVDAAIDAAKAAVNAALDAYEAAINTALDLMTAVLTGNWEDILLKALEVILKLAGIDPAAFYALIGKAKESIKAILADPKSFGMNLVKAVAQGFKQFGQNFLKHFQEQFFNWLFSTSGITMPADPFSVSGIFDLACQVLGLTYPRLREKAVKLLGPRVVGAIEKVWTYVEAFLHGGWAGLWEQVQQDLSGLWSAIVDGVKDWLIQKVVIAAVEKIATMWNPAGAIYQFLKAAWNAYQWVKAQAQRIFGIVEAIVNGIADIVAGNIGPAANYVEDALAKLIPPVLDFFTRVILGLGDVPGAVKGVVGKVQAMVDAALDKLVARIKGLFKAPNEGEYSAAKQELEKKEQFQAGKSHPESHSVWVDAKSPTNPEPMVASNPTTVKEFLGAMESKAAKSSNAEIKTAIGNAQKLSGELDILATDFMKWETKADAKMVGSEELKAQLPGKKAALGAELKKVFEFASANLKEACEAAGGAALQIYNMIMAESQPGAAAVRDAFIAAANVELEKNPDPLAAMQAAIKGQPDRFLCKGSDITKEMVEKVGGINRILDLPSVYDYYLEGGYKALFPVVDHFMVAVAAGKFNTQTNMNGSATLKGKVPMTWWAAGALAPGTDVGKLMKEAHVDDPDYQKGAVRLDMSPDDFAQAMVANGLKIFRPTAFDGAFQITQGGGAMFKSAESEGWGLTHGGAKEAVMKEMPLSAFKTRNLVPPPASILPPKTVSSPSTPTIDKAKPELAKAMFNPDAPKEIYSSGGDPKETTYKILTEHKDARYDASSATLTLPPLDGGAITSATSLSAAGAEVAKETGVSKVTLEGDNTKKKLVGKVNPESPLAEVPRPDRTEEAKKEIAEGVTPPITEGAKTDPPAKLDPEGPKLEHKSDSSDPIKLKEEVVTLTKDYIALPYGTADAELKTKLDAIKAKFELLRTAMKHARGEDDKLVQVRVQFEKFLGTKAEGEWPQGVQCVETMVANAKSMIASSEAKVTGDAATVDAALAKLPPDVKSEIGAKIGMDVNKGFAGVVGKSFDVIMNAISGGSIVQKAQGLIGFTDGYLIPKLLEGAGAVLDRAKANLAAVDPKLDLLKLIDEAKKKTKPKEQKAILLTSPEFQAKLKEAGSMDTKIPEQPIEAANDGQLDFIAQEVNPPVDLGGCKTREDKIKKLKAANVTTTKPKDAMVDATSITQAMDGVTVESKAYIEGKLENIVDPQNAWIMDANKAQAPLKAGISGTTARFVGAANLLGGDKNGAVVAMLGHLQKIEAHSFWEIVAAAGLGMSAGKYTPFPPNDPGMQAAAEEFVDQNGFKDLGTQDKELAKKTLLGETT